MLVSLGESPYLYSTQMANAGLLPPLYIAA